VEFSKRIAVIAGIATWGCVTLGLLSAYLTAQFVPEAPVDLTQVWAWTAFGALLAALTTVLALQAHRSGVALNQTQSLTVGRVILVANVVYITGLAVSSGGLLGSASVLLAVNVLFASLLFSRWGLVGFAVLLSASVAFTGTITGTWTGTALASSPRRSSPSSPSPPESARSSRPGSTPSPPSSSGPPRATSRPASTSPRWLPRWRTATTPSSSCRSR